jgi:hypothetical protein
MKNCILCGKQTSGSIGAAGLRWSMICQPCKDKEDKALVDNLRFQQQAEKIIDSWLKEHA